MSWRTARQEEKLADNINKSGELCGQDINKFLKPLQHNPSLVKWGVALLEDSISSWESKRHVRVQLIRNDVQIVRNFHGLFYHETTGPRAAHENVPQSIIPPPPACV
ncbi:hypothetical protein AVEN_72160-1 [Araneus ventricosus]|uniref:Uncharacterized protein n=1 Tax=Araneus ventricosus TaxID=182803 RepID=A0A4Y2J7P2_ARAVE|nr:hypothetical protein AVEN_72160-1 [Araneus ventricosus]